MPQFPPRFNRRVYYSAPERHQEDLLQEAWVAYAEGRSSTTAARNYLAREMLHEERETASSAPDQWPNHLRGRHRKQPPRRPGGPTKVAPKGT